MANKDVAIPIVFPDYLIAVPTPALTVNLPDVIPFIDVLPPSVKIPAKTHKVENLGHAGILFIQGTSGLTRYYEYGRYDPAAKGLTRKQAVPDVKIGRNGRPTKASLARSLTAVSKQAGQGGRIAGAYIELDPGAFERMDGYAVARMDQNRDAKRESYDLFTHSCLHFMKSTAEAGGARMPGVLAPHPVGYIFQVQVQENDLELTTTGTLMVEATELE